MQACSNVKSDKDSVNLDTIIDGSSPLERACREAERKFGKQVLRIPCTRAMRRIRACKQRGTCMNREIVPHPPDSAGRKSQTNRKDRVLASRRAAYCVQSEILSPTAQRVTCQQKVSITDLKRPSCEKGCAIAQCMHPWGGDWE